ncbi:MAG: WD40 repeat domain-containing protein, partial [Saprospiraceae bacterium]|nr:WD40 repeat domain-containing protein [Saprospiraceae bacterium]
MFEEAINTMKKHRYFTLALLFTATLGFTQKPELVSYQEGHPSEPHQVCMSKDGRLALSGSKERIVLWDLEAGKYIRHIDTDVQHFSFSADERNVLVVSNDSLLQAWSLASGKSLWATGLQKDIKTLTMQWSPDRRSLVTYNSAGLVSVWNLETGQRRWEKKWKPGGSLIEFSGSGNAFALRSAKGALLGGFKCDTGEEDNTFSTKLPLESKKLAVISSSKSIYRSETQITFFDLQHQVTKSLPELTTRFELFKSEDQPDLLLVSASNYNCFVSDFSFSPDGSKLAIAMGTHTAFFGSAPGLPLKRTGHGEIVIWDTKGDSLLQHLDSLPELITTLTFSNSGNELLSGCYNADVQYWNVDSKKELFLLRRKPTMEHGFSFSYDFRQLAMNKFDASFRTWNLSQRTGVNYREPSYYISPYYSARDFDKFALNNSGKQMITCGREGSIHLWKTAPLEHLGKLEDRHSCLEVANAIAISPDSKKALVFSADESRVLTFRQILYPIEEVQSFITNAANDTVGIVLQQGEMYGAVRVDAGKVEHIGGDTIENKIVRIFPSYSNFSLWDLEKKQSERVFYQDELEGDEDDFWVGFSPDVKFALASCRGKMIAWNIQSGARMKNENQDNTFHAMALNTP